MKKETRNTKDEAVQRADSKSTKKWIFVGVLVAISCIGVIIILLINNSDKFQTLFPSVENNKNVYGTTEDGLYDYIRNNDTITLTKYLGNEEEVIIPSEIDGAAVTVIGNGLFSNNNSIVSVIIPNTVTEIQGGNIGGAAFCYMKKLQKVTIPESIKVIGQYTFSGCFNLTEVLMQEGVEEIGCSAFEGCYSLKEITIPKSVKKLGSGCFCKTGVTSITINPECEVEGDIFIFNTEGEINYYE